MYSNCMDLVPSKFSSTRFNQPWVNTRLKLLCRERKRLYSHITVFDLWLMIVTGINIIVLKGLPSMSVV